MSLSSLPHSAHKDSTTMATTVLLGDTCSNVCFGYVPGDITPDYLALFGPAFGDLIGKPFELDINGSSFSLTINNHTVAFTAPDPHFAISFTDPLLSSFSPGAFMFTATGFNPYGIASIETIFGCPEINPLTPGVPEPTTWALLLLGFALLAGLRRLRCNA